MMAAALIGPVHFLRGNMAQHGGHEFHLRLPTKGSTYSLIRNLKSVLFSKEINTHSLLPRIVRLQRTSRTPNAF